MNKKIIFLIFFTFIFSLFTFAEEVDRVIATVNGEIITMNDLYDELLSQGFAADKNSFDIEKVNLVINDMIDEILLMQEAGRRKIETSDDKVNKSVEETMKALKSPEMTNEEFEKKLSENNIDLKKLKKKLYQKYKNNFTIQTLISSSFIVSDKDVVAYEEELKAKGLPIDGYHLAQILIRVPKGATESQAAKLKARAYEVIVGLKKGKKFSELSLEVSDDENTKYNGGDMGYFDDTQLIKPISDAVKVIKQGEVADLIKTDQGFHIVKLIDKSTAKERLFKKRFIENRTQMIKDLRKKAVIKIYNENEKDSSKKSN